MANGVTKQQKEKHFKNTRTANIQSFTLTFSTVEGPKPVSSEEDWAVLTICVITSFP
jgi:hypothetical protein